MSSLSLPQLIVEYLIDSPICEHPYLIGSRAEFINFSAAPPLTNSWSFLQSCGSLVPAHYPISALFKSSQWPATLFQTSHLQTVPHSWPPSPLLHCTFENLRHFLCLFSWPYIQKTSELPCKTFPSSFMNGGVGKQYFWCFLKNINPNYVWLSNSILKYILPTSWKQWF